MENKETLAHLIMIILRNSILNICGFQGGPELGGWEIWGGLGDRVVGAVCVWRGRGRGSGCSKWLTFKMTQESNSPPWKPYIKWYYMTILNKISHFHIFGIILCT